MQALILVGGEGTRLRPLTSVAPKPVLRLVDRPFMAYMLEWLARHGVDHAVMSCGYKSEGIRAVLGDGSQYGVRVTYVEEPEPMGTGGALKYCEEHLEETFLMLNGDVLTDIDVTAQLRQHRESGARGTLGLYPVEDPSAYGLVRVEPGGEILGFVEKPDPSEIDTNTISAGIYVLHHSVLDLLEPGRPASIERDVFPRLVGHGLYGYVAERAYWMDIGTPDRYLQATFDIVTGAVATSVQQRMDGDGTHVEPGARVEGDLRGPVLVESGASVAAGARVGPRAIVCENVQVGPGALVEGSVLLPGARVGAGCVLSDCVIAEDAVLGEGCEITGQAMIGRGARVGAGNLLGSGARVFPGVTIPDRAIKV